jgi:putative acetyltransferase
MQFQVTYHIANTVAHFETGKQLFEEYALSLNVDLSFQGFSNELDTIARQYNKPEGGLLLAFYDDAPAGCAGVRKLDEGTAELKRMYVKDVYGGIKSVLPFCSRQLIWLNNSATKS